MATVQEGSSPSWRWPGRADGGEPAFVGDLGPGRALSDEQLALLGPVVRAARPGGRPCTTDMHRLLDGLFYLVRTGCR